MRVVVVGGSSSIGREIVSAFDRRGAEVLATHTAHPVGSSIHLNVTSIDSLTSFGAAVEAFRPIDVVVFASGVLPGKAINAYSLDEMADVMGVNATGAALVAQQVLPRMRSGHLLILGSISGLRGSYDPIYAASKAALIGLAKSLAKYNADQARVNYVAPALVEDSAMFYDMTPERRQHHAAASPTGKLITKTDLAEIIVDLTGPAWKHLNGAIIDLTGGVA